MYKNVISLTSLIPAFVVANMGEMVDSVHKIIPDSEKSDLIKFLAPIVAGLLGKLIDKLWERRQAKKKKESEVKDV
jgi:hypothetical protein